jgi:hypothetical protein
MKYEIGEDIKFLLGTIMMRVIPQGASDDELSSIHCQSSRRITNSSFHAFLFLAGGSSGWSESISTFAAQCHSVGGRLRLDKAVIRWS